MSAAAWFAIAAIVGMAGTIVVLSLRLAGVRDDVTARDKRINRLELDLGIEKEGRQDALDELDQVRASERAAREAIEGEVSRVRELLDALDEHAPGARELVRADAASAIERAQRLLREAADRTAETTARGDAKLPRAREGSGGGTRADS